jgi:hypothetical protein
MLLSWQRKKRLRESLAFRSFERCSSCDLEVLEVLEGVLGIHGGVLGLAADWILLQWRSRGKSGWKSWVLDYGGGRFWWSGGWMEWLWMRGEMDGWSDGWFVPWSGLVVECSGPLPL